MTRSNYKKVVVIILEIIVHVLPRQTSFALATTIVYNEGFLSCEIKSKNYVKQSPRATPANHCQGPE